MTSIGLNLTSAEEVALFAARRAVVTGTIGRALVGTLRQLCRSERRVIREHAVHLAHQAAAIEWTRRQGDAA